MFEGYCKEVPKKSEVNQGKANVEQSNGQQHGLIDIRKRWSVLHQTNRKLLQCLAPGQTQPLQTSSRNPFLMDSNTLLNQIQLLYFKIIQTIPKMLSINIRRLIILTLSFQIIQSFQFPARLPKVLWLYWDSGFENSPPTVQLSLQNIHAHLNGTGWQIRMLTNSNLHLYLDQEELSQVVRQSELDFMLSDEIRLRILIKYGGVYMESSCFLLGDFSWLERINTNPDVVNKYGDPQAILFFTTYQSSMQYRIYQDQEFLISPGAQSWFIAALPDSTFLKLWLAQNRLFILHGRQFIELELSVNQIKTGALASDPKNLNHYFSIYQAFHAVVQKRQKQLDLQTTPTLPLAVQEFKLWFIPAIKGPFRMMLKHNINFEKRGIQILSEYSQSELENYLGEFKYLLKVTGSVRRIMDNIIADPQKVRFKESWRLPENYRCLNTYYFVKDSIFDKQIFRHMGQEQKNRFQIVDKDMVPWICKQTDIDQLFLGSLLYIVSPLFLATIACLFGRRNHKRGLDAVYQGINSLQVLRLKRIDSTLATLCSCQSMLALVQLIISLIAFLVELLAWSLHILSDIGEIAAFNLFLFFWILYFKKTITKPQTPLGRCRLRITHMLVLLSAAYYIQRYNLTMVGNKNQDNNSFYCFGFMIGVVALFTVHFLFIVTLSSVEVNRVLVGHQPMRLLNYFFRI